MCPYEDVTLVTTDSSDLLCDLLPDALRLSGHQPDMACREALLVYCSLFSFDHPGQW